MLVADDEAMVRASLRTILSTAPDIEVVAEAADGRQAVAVAQAVRPDVVLLDIRMPLLDGLGAATELGRTVPEVAVIMVTTFSEDAYIAGALDSGVSGFLLKTGDPYELMAAVRAAHDGACYLSPKVAQRVISHLGGSRMARRVAALERIDRLTPREREVLALLGAGLSNAEIGRRLYLVEGTVKAYVSTLLSRLEVQQPSAGRGARPRSGTGHSALLTLRHLGRGGPSNPARVRSRSRRRERSRPRPRRP